MWARENRIKASEFSSRRLCKSLSFAKHTEKGNTLIFVDDLSANWLRVKAEASNTTPEAIIRQLVSKELAAAI